MKLLNQENYFNFSSYSFRNLSIGGEQERGTFLRHS